MIVVEWGTQVDNGIAHIVFNGVSPTTTAGLMATTAYIENPDPNVRMSPEDQARINQAQPAPQLGRHKEPEKEHARR